MTSISRSASALRLPPVLAGYLAALPRGLLALLLPLALLLLWQLAAEQQWVSSQLLPPPSLVLDSLLDLYSSGELASNLGISLARVLWGFAAGSAAGLLLGVAMGLSPRVEAYLLPTFKAISLVPVIGWVPLFILFVGIEESLKVLVIAKAVMVPVAINAMKGIRNVPVGFFEVARLYRFSLARTVRKVVLPAALPSLANGLRLGLSNAWMALVAVELLASSEGIGYLMVYGRQLFQLDLVMATMVVIGLVGLVLDQGLQLLERRLLSWRNSAY